MQEQIQRQIDDIRARLRQEHEVLDRFEEAIKDYSADIRGRIRNLHRLIDGERGALMVEIEMMFGAIAGPKAIQSPPPQTGKPPLPHEIPSQDVTDDVLVMPRYIQTDEPAMAEEALDKDRFSFRGARAQ